MGTAKRAGSCPGMDLGFLERESICIKGVVVVVVCVCVWGGGGGGGGGVVLLVLYHFSKIAHENEINLSHCDQIISFS